jgi:ABC-type uncharacterized transport system auxiliary subunit
MNKAILTAALVALALSGCSVLGGHNAPPPKQYTLSPPLVPGGKKTPSQHFPAILRVASPSAPGWLNKSNMYYRLAYEQQSRIGAYARSSWLQPPPEMIEQALQQHLTQSQLFKAVIGPDSSGAAELELRVHIANFLQRFMSPNDSDGLFDAYATLVNLASNRVLGQKEFRYHIATPTADAQGGVQALGTASGKFTAAVTQWVAQTLSHCASKCLGGTGNSG